MGSMCRVLIADDNRESADTLALLLKLSGFETETVYDGLEAASRARETVADVVILDLTMPGLDGFEVARGIRELPWGRDVTILACTGWTADSDRLRTREAGFDAHLTKPLDFSALLDLLRRAASRRRSTTRACA